MRSSVDVHNFLTTEGVQHEIFALEGNARTAKRMAAMLGLKPSEVAKTLIFVVDEEPVLAIVPADKKADPTKIKAALGKSRIDFADVRMVLDVTDYCIGGTPPVAHKTTLPCVIDARLLKRDIVYTGGGEVSMVLKIRSEDLKKVTEGTIADICS